MKHGLNPRLCWGELTLPFWALNPICRLLLKKYWSLGSLYHVVPKTQYINISNPSLMFLCCGYTSPPPQKKKQVRATNFWQIDESLRAWHSHTIHGCHGFSFATILRTQTWMLELLLFVQPGWGNVPKMYLHVYFVHVLSQEFLGNVAFWDIFANGFVNWIYIYINYIKLYNYKLWHPDFYQWDMQSLLEE